MDMGQLFEGDVVYKLFISRGAYYIGGVCLSKFCSITAINNNRIYFILSVSNLSVRFRNLEFELLGNIFPVGHA